MTTTRQPMQEIQATLYEIAHQVTAAKHPHPVRFVAYDKTGQCKPFGLVSLREIWKLELLEKMAGSENPDFRQISRLFETPANDRAGKRAVRNLGKGKR